MTGDQLAASAIAKELYRTLQPLPGLKAGTHDLNLTRVTFPPQMPSNPPHHRSGGALYYVVSGTGANTVEGKIEPRPPEHSSTNRPAWCINGETQAMRL